MVAAACVAAIALAAWPVQSLRAGVGGDWGWMAGLAHVAEHGMRFGDQIVWTYGPLGFLDTWYGPVLYYGDVLLLAWAYVALLQVLLAVVLLVALRRSLPLAAAVVVATVVLALTVELVPALAVALCALLLTRSDRAATRPSTGALAFALGVLTGVALLGKLNQGLELAVFAAIVLVAEPRRREALALAAGLLSSATIGWFASGQTLADAWPFVRNGAEIVAGYAAAMGVSDPGLDWSYFAALALAASLLGLTWAATPELPLRRRWALLALYAVAVAFAFKEGFVRQDPGHLEVFFASLLVPFAMLPPEATRRVAVLAPIAMAGCAVAIGGLLGAGHAARRLDPIANATAAADQLRTLASASRQDAITADLRARLDAVYRLPPGLRAAVGRRPVMLWPLLFGEVAYAYGLDLRPLPSFEPYAAYTPALDRLGARMLASERAPARILRLDAVVGDGGYPTFEAPLAALGIFCRYRQTMTQAEWQLLAPARDRCGAPRPLGTRTAPWGADVTVPPATSPSAAVVVHVEGAGPHGLERLRALLLRPRPRWIALDGRRYPLVAATAADGLLLSAPAGLDYPAPFAMAPGSRVIAVGREGDQPGGSVTYRFEEIPLRRISPVARAP